MPSPTHRHEAGRDQKHRRIGVLRSYFTRHGNGPFVTEDNPLRSVLPEPHNADAGQQGKFRVGVFDAVAAGYAASVGGVDELAVTHLDRIPMLPDHICTEYRKDSNTTLQLRLERGPDLREREQLTRDLLRCRPVFTSLPGHTTDDFLAALERELRLPVRLTSFGPRATDKRVC